jgi:hypothetical protein
MKHRYIILALFAGALVFTTACGMVTSLFSGRSSGTVNELWADVPRMDGMEKADMEMPLAARLGLQAIMQGRMNFIAYTTDASPQAVLDFYTAERMAEQGWTTQEGTGCFGDAETAEAGTICVFTKSSDAKNEFLGIVAANDAETNQTAVFFARVDASEAATEDTGN